MDESGELPPDAPRPDPWAAPERETGGDAGADTPDAADTGPPSTGAPVQRETALGGGAGAAGPLAPDEGSAPDEPAQDEAPAPERPHEPAPAPAPAVADETPPPALGDEEPAPAGPRDLDGHDQGAAVSGVLEADPDAAPVAAVPRAVPPFPRWVAVANQKGGVGKTTTAVNLGACLAELDYRVLIVDLDPQGNATTGLGLNPRELDTSMYDVILNDVAIEDCVEPSAVRNLFVAPASLDLAGAEIELVPAFSRELRLRRALEEVSDDYDFVLIDCPPSLGLLTINGLAAATEVLVPIQCEYYALEGLGQLLRNVGLVQRNLNPRLELRTIVLVMHDARTKLSDQVVREVRDHFGDTVCRIVIPRTVRLSEAPSYGQPIVAFDPTSRGAIAYRELAKEVSGGAPQRTR